MPRNLREITIRVRGRSHAVKVVPRCVRRMIEALEREKYLVRLTALADDLGITINTIHRFSTHPALGPHRYELGYNDVVFGSRKTIAKLRDKDTA